jgi:hypothetical protein
MKEGNMFYNMKESKRIDGLRSIAFAPFAIAMVLYLLSYPFPVLLLPSGFLLVAAAIWFVVWLPIWWRKRKAFLANH